jgi:glucose-6-phosphate isomerase/transaldolase/glucose-6-phosphate isomerase
VERLQSKRFVKRLWDKDASLWTSESAVQATIQQRLGWLIIPRTMAHQTESLRRFAQEIRDAGFTHALLLGMGGSSLFSEVCRNLFGVAVNHLDLTVLDTTDPTAIRTHQQRQPLEQLLVIVSSKSGLTSEVSALSRYFYETFKLVDENPGARCLAITDAGTSLETQARAWNFRRIFVHGPGTGAEVGGRFSALTYFGLVPAALIGVDIGQLLRKADEMFSRCGPETPIQDNPAAQLGCVLGTLAQAGRDKLTLLCAPPVTSFGAWAEQLVAESTGKQGGGIAPIHGESLREPTAYEPDRVFVELQLAHQIDKTLEHHVRALAEAGHPIVRVLWQDPYDLGGEVAKWFIATAVAGSLLEINPFDEPNVQGSKDRTRALLERYTREGQFREEEQPLYSDAEMSVYGTTGSGKPASVSQCLAEFFQQLRVSDYVVLLSFLPRTSALDRAVQMLRERIGQRLGHATMLEVGPRYLHSTGQLYKGGPDDGLFFLLTAEEGKDLPIPGEPFTFGTLKHAQALGDFQAMQQGGRRVLRLHFRCNVESTLQRLAGGIDDMELLGHGPT